jgi:hypothetical protein
MQTQCLLVIALENLSLPEGFEINSVAKLFMEQEKSTPSHKQGEYMAGVCRIDEKTTRVCVALRQIVEQCVEKKYPNGEWPGKLAVWGFNKSQAVLKFGDTPCLDISTPNS